MDGNKSNNKTVMKEGTYEEIKYGDETFIVNKETGKIEPNYTIKNSQGRTVKQEEDSAKILAYSLLGLVGMIIVLMIIM
jgi:hypothetical protein